MGRALLVAILLAGCPASTPVRCPYAPASGGACPICVTRPELAARGEVVEVPSLRRPPPGGFSRMWSGRQLPLEPPSASLYVRCRPCDCSADGALTPWPDWEEINRRAYERLRAARAPYPVAIVTGYHAGTVVSRYRVSIALQLVRHGWVAALLLSGGHRRGGVNESRRMLAIAHQLAREQGIDLRDRVLVEPCATRTSTNLRNSLRMMAALGLERGLLVTESKVTGQATVFASDLDALVHRDLRCAVGRVSHLYGMTSLLRTPGSRQGGCRAPLSLRHNYLFFALPRREPVIYWVSPFTRLGGGRLSALDCSGGGPLVQRWEPDDRNPWTSECLPPLRPCGT